MSTAWWISGKLFVGSGKEYKELKEKQVLGLFSGGKDVSIGLLTGYATTKALAMHPGIFQWVKRLRDGIVLVVSLLAAIVKDLVALSKWSTFLCLHGLIVAALRCTY